MSLSVSAKIPFQPGLSLGSIVRGDVLEKLEAYNEALSSREKFQIEVRNLEQGLKTLQEKISSIRGDSPANQVLRSLFQAQIDSITESIDTLVKETMNLQRVSIPFFSNMTTSLESPIDFAASIIATDCRGFDSITFSSQYIDMYESSQRIQDKMDQISSANSMGVGASFAGFSIGGSYSWSNGAMKRVAEIKSQGFASKILFINAMVTTRHVRYLKDKKYDLIKLETLLSTMKQSDKEADLNKQGITFINGNKSVYLLTEAVMGGSFSAIVTYLKDDSFQRNLNEDSNYSSSFGGIKLSAPALSTPIGSLKGKGSFHRSSQKASESEEDQLQNQANLNISIEYIAQGVIPQFARDKVVREVQRYQKQDFRKYEPVEAWKKGESVEERQRELQKTNYTTLNDTRSTEKEEEALSVHSVTGVMKAYDDFCGAISSDENAGVPIGFNYTILTQGKIEEILQSQLPKKGSD